MKIIFIFLFFFIPRVVFGAAFLIYNQDAKANGMGMAASASVDNSSAVFYHALYICNGDCKKIRAVCF